MGSFVLLAIIMGLDDPIYSIKILAVAICFWMISLTYNHKTLAWTSSIFTVLSSIWILTQVVPLEGDEADEGLTIIFLVISFVGVIMMIMALINEVKFVGEPITASLAITGSIITFVTIFAPSFVDTNSNLFYFLPNAVWAIQGLILYSFSQRYSKEYLRRIGFGILMIDIVKTVFDMFRSDLVREEPLIQFGGAIALGSILIYIFYTFTSEKEQDLPENKN